MGTINLTWWNLANFFDTDDDPIARDFDFTAANGWTQDVFDAKLANLAAALAATHGGAGPDLLAVAEIENDALLEQLIAAMGMPHLKVIPDPAGTSDLRGIDVAMAYHRDKLTLVNSRTHVVHLHYRTRDIFEVELQVKESGENFVVIAGHWPSRQRGKEVTEPLRIAVAENIACLVQDRVKVSPQEYEELRALDNFDPVRRKWEAKILVVGDFNDEPSDRSVLTHLKASRELGRVVGETNDIDGFEKETSDYRSQDVFLFNPMWKFASQQEIGTHFLDSTRSGGKLANRYSLLDQVVVSRGLLAEAGLRLDPDSVAIFRDPRVSTRTGRPRPFDWKTKKGTSDHLPLTARLVY